jgi:hypothetical protein
MNPSHSRRAAWRIAPALAAALLLAPVGAAQFNLVNWTPDLDGTIGSIGVAAESMGIAASDSTAPGTVIGFHSVAPVAGRVLVEIDFYMTWDGMCNASVPVFILNGTTTVMASCSTFDAHYEFLVSAGADYGFGLATFMFGWPGIVELVNFDFQPLTTGDPWTNLQSGLPGTTGTPALTGTSLLYPHFPFTLDVTNAAASAPAAFIVGFSAINAPFKGGVLVPSVDLILPGLVTTLTGTLQLATSWPGGVPAGFAFYFQAWIVDAGGPAGFAASNALKATSP